MNLSLLTIFGAGVGTLATPCILPMLPVYISLLMGASLDSAKDPKTRFRLVISAILFVSGFSLVFTLLGLGASSVGGALQSHRSLLLMVGGAVIILFGLKYLGVLRIGLLDRTVQMKELKTGSRYVDALLFGVVFALGWTPCVGPILGTVLTYTAARTGGSPWMGAMYLFVYSLGVGLPLIVVSLAADRLIPRIRKLNRHIPKFEKATGFVMVAVGLFLLLPPIWDRIHADPAGVAVHIAISDEGTKIDPPLGHPTEVPRLVEFYEKDCPVCKKMKPRFAKLKDDCVSRGVEILTIDISDPRNHHLAEEFGIAHVPTIKLFGKDGKVQGEFFGERKLSELHAAAAGLMDAVCMGETGKTKFKNDKPACLSGNRNHHSDDGVPNFDQLDDTPTCGQ